MSYDDDEDEDRDSEGELDDDGIGIIVASVTHMQKPYSGFRFTSGCKLVVIFGPTGQ